MARALARLLFAMRLPATSVTEGEAATSGDDGGVGGGMVLSSLRVAGFG